jgi:hypothetical protein
MMIFRIREVIAALMIALSLVAVIAPSVCLTELCCDESMCCQDEHGCECLCSVVANFPKIEIDAVILREVWTRSHSVYQLVPGGFFSLPERPPIAAC